jgi:signal transduction histidine kinase
LIGFNLNDCSSIEGPIATYYVYLIEALFIVYSVLTVMKYAMFSRLSASSTKLLIPYGVLIFLFIFTIGNIYGSTTKNWVYGDIGLIGVPLLISVILYSTIKYRFIDKSLDGKKIIIIIVWILLASLITISNLDLLHLVILITLLVIISLSNVVFTITSRESLHLSQISSLASSLKDLNDNLEAKVNAQTAEIKKSYELEQNAHRELVKLSDAKDNFISIAQHNLRIPITNINNKIEDLIKNSGNLDMATKTVLVHAKDSLDNLNEIADEFRNISKMKRGSQILQPTKESILPVISNVMNELYFEIDRMNISITYPTLPESWPLVNIDRNKIKDAFIVVMENAIKYNQQDGYIQISNRIEGDKLIICIKNSGLGLSDQEKENLDKHNFYRSERVKNMNPVGMGIGLYLAKSIIEAHHGNLSISSNGENLGAIVVITIPIDFLKRDK